MTSEKFIYKKEYEHVDRVDESVWLGNDTPIMESDFTFVFNDRYPCVPGHKLFIPKENNSHFVNSNKEYYVFVLKKINDFIKKNKP